MKNCSTREDGAKNMKNKNLIAVKVRRAIKGFINDNADYERLLPFVKGMRPNSRCGIERARF